jgi:GT2 family glycosyltransferase
LKLATGDRPFASVIENDGDARLARVWPPIIDRSGTVPAKSWGRWLEQGRSGAASPARTDAPPPTVVLRPGSGDEAGLERTRQALAAQGLTAIPPEAAPASPDALHLYLEAGDLPDPALLDALRETGRAPGVDVITFDLFRRTGDRVQPLLLPGANLTLLRAGDYIFSRAAIRGAAIQPGLGTARDAILSWSASRRTVEVRAGWRHLSGALLHVELGEDALDERRRRRFAPAERAAPRASAILCTHNKGYLLRQLVRQLLALDESLLAEVVIVSNNTTNPYALQALTDLARQARVQVIRDDRPFNFSRQCNAGVKAAQGRGPMLLLNDDITPVSEDWLAVLAHHLTDPEVGVVGPLLLYPDERVQQAGMYLGFPNGAGHILRGAALPQDDPLGFAAGPREVSCLTGAAMLSRREAYEAVGGLDETLAVSFQDVDYCLRLQEAGLRCVFEPRSILIHMESATLGKDGGDAGRLTQRYEERRLMTARWGARLSSDPFVPAMLNLSDEGLRRFARPGEARRP